MLLRVKIVGIVVIVFCLSSCGYIVRQSGFVESDWPKLADNRTPRALELWKDPKIEIESNCDGTNYTVLWGPYIALPLFIIPNPFWPFTYTYHTTHHVKISIAIVSSTTDLDWAAISTKIHIGGHWLKPDRIEDISDKNIRQHVYIFDTSLTCSKLENSEIGINIASDPPQANLTTKVIYKHHWRVNFEGI